MVLWAPQLERRIRAKGRAERDQQLRETITELERDGLLTDEVKAKLRIVMNDGKDIGKD